jgi:hypothetical protein
VITSGGDDRTLPVAPMAAAGFRERLVPVLADLVFKAFRASFTGKWSPVHVFRCSNALAVTRFPGRPAPLHRGGAAHLPDAVTREAQKQDQKRGLRVWR